MKSTTRFTLIAVVALLSTAASAQVTFKNPAGFHVQYEVSCAGKSSAGTAVNFDTKATQSSRESCADAERQMKTFLTKGEACRNGVVKSSRFLPTPSCTFTTAASAQATDAAAAPTSFGTTKK